MKRNHIIILIVSLVVLAGAGAGIWYWQKKKKEKEELEGKGDSAIKDTLEVELDPEQQKQRAAQEAALVEKKKLSSAEQKARTVLDGQANIRVKKGLMNLIKPAREVTPHLLKNITQKAANKITGGAEPLIPEIQKKRM